MTETAEELLTINELAKKFKVTRQAIWLWRRKGYIAGRRMGGRVYFLASEIMEALKK